MKKYRKKPVVIEALQFDGKNYEECLNLSEDIFMFDGDNYLNITTLEGTMKCSVGDYIIKGVNGEFYPCKPDIFKKTYEEAWDGRE